MKYREIVLFWRNFITDRDYLTVEAATSKSAGTARFRVDRKRSATRVARTQRTGRHEQLAQSS